MAKNIGGRRIGAVRGRTQFQLPDGLWAKRDRMTGKIIAVKKDGEPFKGVVRERETTVLASDAGAPLLPFPPKPDSHDPRIDDDLLAA